MAGIGATGGLANEAFRAALKAQQDAARQIGAPGGPGPETLPTAPAGPGQLGGAAPVEGTNFASKLEEGLADVAKSVQVAETMPAAMVSGDVGEFHEVALALKQSDLSFRFALQVRNKLIDAYREVMRMSV